jgi:hypothetical protein
MRYSDPVLLHHQSLSEWAISELNKNAQLAFNDLQCMLSMHLKYKITDIRPEHSFYFLLPMSSTHTGLNCVKNSAMNISCFGTYKVCYGSSTDNL